MRTLEELRESYVHQPAKARMGHLASDLLRLSRWVQAGTNHEATARLLDEIAACMEWNPEHATEELANMQREVCHWRRLWPLEALRDLLAFRARLMSDRILELAVRPETDCGHPTGRPRRQGTAGKRGT